MPEWRTRYRARADLQARPQADVLAAADDWLAELRSVALPEDVADRLETEVLWLQQSFHAVDRRLLGSLLEAATPDARAAATRVLAEEANGSLTPSPCSPPGPSTGIRGCDARRFGA